MEARWHQDSDRWIWRVYYDEGDGSAVTTKGGEDTTDIYIVPRDDGWWILNAKTLMNGKDWIAQVNDGGGVRIAGPFANEQDAKAAWRVMYG